MTRLGSQLGSPIDVLAFAIRAHNVGRPINVSMDVAIVNPARGATDATVECVSEAATNMVMKAKRHITPRIINNAKTRFQSR